MATNNPYGWIGNAGQQSPQYRYGAGGTGLNPTGSQGYNDYGGNYGSPPSNSPNTSQVPSYNPNSQSGGLNDLMNQWRGSQFSQPGYYGNKDQSMNADRYATNYATPYGNLLLQQEAQADARNQFGVTSAMQNWVNQAQYGLDQAASNRENIGLDYGIFAGQQQFGEGQRQFDTTTGLNYAQLGQQGDIARMQNQTALSGLQNQYNIANLQNTTALRGLENQMGIAGMQNQTELSGQRNQYNIAQLGSDTQRYGVDVAARTAASQLGLDYSKLSQDQQQFVQDLALRQQIQQQTYGIQQGQLGVQQGAEARLGRQQGLDEAFRQQQMAQEAQLMRENYANQLTQSRYSAFGRAQAPNFRNVASWR